MAAKKEIEINGHVFNKCYISKQQWKDCITPCTFCHTTVQSACDHNNPFCGNERACFIDLGAIYGEEVNEEPLTEHEKLRRRLSAVCSYFNATENEPLNCDVENGVQLHIQGIDEEAQGLSEAEKPQVTGLFQDQEGIVWITIKYYDEPVEADDLLDVSMQQILEWVSERFQINF